MYDNTTFSDSRLIQDFVSRSESIRTKLSHASWSRGISNFFSESIPFSYSTSTEFAEQLLHLIDCFISEGNLKTCRVHELGAGLGLLSKNIVDVANNNFMHMSHQLHVEVSDSSKESLEAINTLDIFKEHRHRISTHVVDCLQPDFAQPPHVVIMAYLLDSLPTRHIEIDNGRIYELHVRTSLRKNAIIIDTTEMPPRILEEDDIKTLLQGPLNDRKKALLGQLVECLEEETMFIPLDDASLPADERVELEAFIGTLDTTTKLRFNFSYACHKVLHHLFENAPEQALICTYDMGFIQKDTCPEVEQLYGTFGACMFFSIFFPHLAYIAQKFGFETCFSDYTEGQSQMGIFFKGIPVQKLQATFHRVFHEEGGEKPYKIQRSLIELPSNKDSFSSELTQSMAALSPKEKESYTLLYGIAQAYQKRGGRDEAEGYANQLIKAYGRSAISAYYLKADLLNESGQHQEALACLKDAIEAAPAYFRLHHLKALIAGSNKQYNMFLEAARESLKYAPDRSYILWDHLLTMALVYLELNQTRKSRDIFMWISNTELHFPGILPSTLVKRATAISKQFEGFLK